MTSKVPQQRLRAWPLKQAVGPAFSPVSAGDIFSSIKGAEGRRELGLTLLGVVSFWVPIHLSGPARRYWHLVLG